MDNENGQQELVSDLEAIIPEHEKGIELKTNKVNIVKIKIKHLKPILSQVGPLIPIIDSAFRIFEADPANQKLTPESKESTRESQIMELLFTLINDYQDNILALCCILSDMEKSEIEDLDLAEFANLVFKIVEYNIDFFIKTVLPKIAAIRLKA